MRNKTRKEHKAQKATVILCSERWITSDKHFDGREISE